MRVFMSMKAIMMDAGGAERAGMEVGSGASLVVGGVAFEQAR